MNQYFFRTYLAVFLLLSQVSNLYFTGAYQTLNVITVANLNDSGVGSLRQAILDAPDGGTVTFAQGLSGSILLEQPIDLTQNISLLGIGARNITLDGQGKTGGFFLNGMISVKIENLTFVNAGQAMDSIKNPSGFLQVADSNFFHNHGASGGAISSYVGAVSSIRGCNFKSNSAGLGGAVVNLGSMNVEDSTFENNVGAIRNSGNLSITRSTFYANSDPTVVNTPAVVNLHSGYAVVINSTFVSNSGAIKNAGNAILLNDTFYNNTDADELGIYNFQQGSLTLKNTIVVGSGKNCSGSVSDGAGNIQFPGDSCGSTIMSADPKLEPLSNNGGLTKTMALQSTSIAIKAGNSSNCQDKLLGNVDQRAQVRTNIENCDAGAFQSSTVLSTTTS